MITPMHNTANQLNSDNDHKAYIESNRHAFDNLFEPMKFDDFVVELKKYHAVVKALDELFPKMSPWSKCDWGVNYVLRPQFFQDDLNIRINNVMLVSALLITISASAFMSPAGDVDQSDVRYRAFSYLMFLSTIMFVISIFFGVGFIESCLSRNYVESERLFAIIKYYGIFGASQTFMMLGSALLLFGLILSSSLSYIEDDTVVFAIISVVTLITLIALLSIMGSSTSKSQKLLTDTFQLKFCKSDGNLHDDLLNWLESYEIKSSNKKKI